MFFYYFFIQEVAKTNFILSISFQTSGDISQEFIFLATLKILERIS
jgi:hypothetical protein